MASTWSEERVDALKGMWAGGFSARQIAARIGGCTRNAVIGKVHRLGLPGRKTQQRTCARSGGARKPPKPRSTAGQRTWNGHRPPREKSERGFELANLSDIAALATLLKPHAEDLAINRKPLVDLEHGDCHWPIGDPKTSDFGFCGAPVLQKRPYCQGHCARAYRAA